MIDRLCIVGVGLIGGSLAKDLRRLGLCGEIIGCGRKREHLARARELGIIDAYYLDPAKAVEGADLVVLAVPLGAMAAVLEAMGPGLASHAVLTDVGSAKCSVIEHARLSAPSRKTSSPATPLPAPSTAVWRLQCRDCSRGAASY